MKKRIVFLLFMALVSTPLFAQVISPEDALQELFVSGAESQQYSEQFTAAVSVERLQSILDQISGQLGQFQQVLGNSNPYTVAFEDGSATAYIQLTENGQIAGLRFTQISPAAGSVQEAVEQLRDLPGQVAYVVLENGEPVVSYNENTPLAVGSTFKLAVLAALKEAVAEGSLQWNQVVTLDPEWKSLPSGILQNWPEGSPLTIESLATLMISQSDNTATDALIHIMGKEQIEPYTDHTIPLLTTKEAFILKNPENADIKEQYLGSSSNERRDLLTQISGKALPDASLFAGAPVSPEIEWFFSVNELCELIDQVSDLDLTTVNPGLANASEWTRVSFKGGSEPGVLNLTTRLIADDGTVYCVSATQNRQDAALDESAFFIAYQGLLSSLR